MPGKGFWIWPCRKEFTICSFDKSGKIQEDREYITVLKPFQHDFLKSPFKYKVDSQFYMNCSPKLKVLK